MQPRASCLLAKCSTMSYIRGSEYMHVLYPPTLDTQHESLPPEDALAQTIPPPAKISYLVTLDQNITLNSIAVGHSRL